MSSNDFNGELSDAAVSRLLRMIDRGPNRRTPGVGITRAVLVPRRRSQSLAAGLSELGSSLDGLIFFPDAANRPAAVRLSRTNDKPPRLRLSVGHDWPSPNQTIESLTLVSWNFDLRRLSRRVNWLDFKTTVTDAASVTAAIPGEPIDNHSPAAALAAQRLSSNGAADELSVEPRDDIDWTFSNGEMVVNAHRNAARPRVPLVAEFVYEDRQHRFPRIVRLLRHDREEELSPDELLATSDWRVRFEYPSDAIVPQFDICVRDATGADLMWLNDSEFNEALLSTRYVPMLAKPTSDGDVEFTARFQAQHDLLSAPNTAWIVNVRDVDEVGGEPCR